MAGVDDLPTEEEREALLDGLRDLVRVDGASDFLHAPILLPTPEHFPDEWRPDFDGANAMLARLLATVRLGSWAFTLDAVETLQARGPVSVEGSSGHAGTAAWFAGGERGVLRFGLDVHQLDDPEHLAGILVHEVAHAWRFANEVPPAEGRIEEHLTDLTTVFLGGGVLTTNNTFRYRTGSFTSVNGRLMYGSSSSASGYVSPGTLAFALAVMVRCRSKPRESSAIGDALERTQRRLFEKSLDVLPSAETLRLRLGIPPVVELRARPRLPPPVKLAPAKVLTIDEKTDPAHIAFRVRHRNYGTAFIIGVVVSIVAGLLLHQPMFAGLALLAAPLGHWWYVYRCSVKGCGCPLKKSERRCPACHALLVGVEDRGKRSVAPEHEEYVRRLESAKQASLLIELAQSRPPADA